MYSNSTDEKYMRRCLQLAECGRAGASPNPMVGAVIVARGRIIGEGYHIRCGGPHAEVNAFNSVRPADECLLAGATMYVSLEPCAHFGRTPPCADLIVSKGVGRVVVGCVDSFDKVSGRGIQRLRDAGIDVRVGVLEDECRRLNRVFFTFNNQRRPYITLKWAQTADGYIDDHGKTLAISTPFTKMLVHKLRAEHEAILVGRVTAERDNARLNVRHWHGRDPLRLVVDSRQPCFEGIDLGRPVVPQILDELYRRGVQSLLVEGGARTLSGFIELQAWDAIRVETAPWRIGGGTAAPQVPVNAAETDRHTVDGNSIVVFQRADNAGRTMEQDGASDGDVA